MKKIKKYVWVFSYLLIMSVILMGCKEETNNDDPIKRVDLVQISYDGKPINGVLEVNASQDSIQLDVKVEVTGKPEYQVSVDSSNKAVATIDQNSKVSLLSSGETTITAKASDKEHKIVLIVKADGAIEDEKYSITVEGGSANHTALASGEYFNLVANESPLGKIFDHWEFFDKDGNQLEGLWINGSMVEMPSHDVVVKAVLKNQIYKLLVTNATISINGETAEGSLMSDGAYEYNVSYQDDIVLTALAHVQGKMFVGWDENIQNNRIDFENDVLSFAMPAKNMGYKAVFSNVSALGLSKNLDTTGNDSIGQQPTPPSLWGSALINDPTGTTPNDKDDDVDLKGYSGVLIDIQGNAIKDMHNRIRGSKLNNLTNGSVTIDYIFKNYSEDLDLTFELFAESYGAITTTGILTIEKNSVLKKSVVVPNGFFDPWLVLKVRANIGGTSSQKVQLAIVAQQAPTYPEWDPMLEISSPVHLASFPSLGNDRNIKTNNDLGMTMFYGTVPTSAYGLSAKINNLPALEEGATTTKVYIKFISYINSDLVYTVNMGNTASSNNLGTHTFNLAAGSVYLFVLELDRTTGSDIYFSYTGTNAVARQNFVIQLSYTNEFGVIESGE